jgi:hypothetical protein
MQESYIQGLTERGEDTLGAKRRIGLQKTFFWRFSSFGRIAMRNAAIYVKERAKEDCLTLLIMYGSSMTDCRRRGLVEKGCNHSSPRLFEVIGKIKVVSYKS